MFLFRMQLGEALVRSAGRARLDMYLFLLYVPSILLSAYATIGDTCGRFYANWIRPDHSLVPVSCIRPGDDVLKATRIFSDIQIVQLGGFFGMDPQPARLFSRMRSARTPFFEKSASSVLSILFKY
ncbi:hypothetical protein DFH11DRAFT_1616229, partial [Phellopilus nigrolimitatus]